MYGKFLSWRVLSIFILCLVVSLTNSACNPREFTVFKKIAEASDEAETKAAEEAIRRDPKLRMVDQACSAIPLPSDAKFIKKGGLDDQKVTLSTYYSSDTPYQALAVSWNTYFISSNWTLIRRDESDRRKISVYENDAYTVSVQYGGMGDPPSFSFNCTLK